MLNREICRMCQRDHGERDTDADNRWDRDRYVMCPMRFRTAAQMFAFVDGKPPKWCRYVTEHIVSQ